MKIFKTSIMNIQPDLLKLPYYVGRQIAATAHGIISVELQIG
jgi:hypothetical protein